MKKRILFLINDFSGGGAEKILVDIVNSLDKDKYEITCKSLFNRGINRENLGGHIKYQYFSNILIRGYSWISKIIPAKVMYHLIVKDKYDLEISFLEGVCTKVISKSNRKKIAWIHTEFVNESLYTQGFLNLKQVNKAYSNFNCVVSVSQTVKNTFELFSSVKSKVIHNPIKIELNDLTTYNFNSNYFNIVAVGRLTKVKGFDRLLDCVYIVSQKYPVKLYIVGDGEEYEFLKQKIANLELENTVFLLGYRKDVLNIIKNSNLLICSSYREGYSTVVNEAIMLGTPVLTTDCSGMREILLNGELGLIVDNDTDGIVNGLLYLLDDTKKIEDFKNNISKMNKNFTFEKGIKEIEDLIDKCLNGEIK